jgi:glutathione S-transferase
MLRLHGQYKSRAFRVAWFCMESGIAYEHVDVTINVPNASAKTPAYAALNPMMRIPTLEDDGFVVWESAAMVFYLAERYQGSLWPGNAKGRGRAYQWCFFCCNDLEQNMVKVLRRPAGAAALAPSEDPETLLHAKLDVVEPHLASSASLGLDGWDISDLWVASVFYPLWASKYDFTRFPHFKGWLDASLNRPKALEARKLRE